MLCGLDPARITEIPELLAAGGDRDGSTPEGWDGEAAASIVDVVARMPLSEAQPAII
jgi:hypothetical protein